MVSGRIAHRQVGDLIALLLQILGGVEDGVVLDGGGDDVAALPPLQGHELGHPPQGPVVRLRTAGGEVDLLRPGVEAGGDLRPRPLQVGLAPGQSGTGWRGCRRPW